MENIIKLKEQHIQKDEYTPKLSRRERREYERKKVKQIKRATKQRIL